MVMKHYACSLTTSSRTSSFTYTDPSPTDLICGCVVQLQMLPGDGERRKGRLCRRKQLGAAEVRIVVGREGGRGRDEDPTDLGADLTTTHSLCQGRNIIKDGAQRREQTDVKLEKKCGRSKTYCSDWSPGGASSSAQGRAYHVEKNTGRQKRLEPYNPGSTLHESRWAKSRLAALHLGSGHCVAGKASPTPSSVAPPALRKQKDSRGHRESSRVSEKRQVPSAPATEEESQI